MPTINDDFNITRKLSDAEIVKRRKKQVLFENTAGMEEAALANLFRKPIIDAFQNGKLNEKAITTNLIPSEAKKALSFIQGRTNTITTQILIKLYLLIKTTVHDIVLRDCHYDIEL